MGVSTVAPRSTSMRTTSTCPFSAASSKGVAPLACNKRSTEHASRAHEDKVRDAGGGGTLQVGTGRVVKCGAIEPWVCSHPCRDQAAWRPLLHDPLGTRWPGGTDQHPVAGTRHKRQPCASTIEGTPHASSTVWNCSGCESPSPSACRCCVDEGDVTLHHGALQKVLTQRKRQATAGPWEGRTSTTLTSAPRASMLATMASCPAPTATKRGVQPSTWSDKPRQ